MTERQQDAQPEKAETPFAVRDVPLERIIASLPTWLRQVISVLRFEFRRSFTWARSSAWLVLALFPVGIMLLLRFADPNPAEQEVWGYLLYALIPQVVCLLGLLLWVCPLLHAELEGRTWIYLAVRPHGIYTMLLGKYCNGLLWTGSAAAVGLTLSMLVSAPLLRATDPWRLYVVLLLVSVCSCCAYGAVYTTLGVLFPRRAIVVSVAFMLVFELLVSNIPAVVNQFTIQYRLNNILQRGMGWEGGPLRGSDQPIAVHLAILCGVVLFYLTISLLMLRFREYATAEQNH